MFSKLVGNDDVKDTLRRLIASGRVPNSLLLVGDEGVGKRQFALEIAKTFVCLEPADGIACDMCAACRRVDHVEIPSGDKRDKDDFEKVFFTDHIDVGLVVTYKRVILVDAIRELERHANFRPYEARARVFIIDEAEKMNDNAANCLLKILEEPPPTSFIFLVTSRPDSLLPTIRSRCQMLRFAPIETEKIEKYLVEERKFENAEARLAARLSRGSIGRAVSINVTEFRTARDRMLNVIKSAIQTGDLATMFRIAEELNDAKNKDKFESNLDILESLIHDVWSLKVSGDTSRVVNTDVTDDLARLAIDAARADLPSWLAEIEMLRQNLAVNINRKIAADALFVSMAG